MKLCGPTCHSSSPAHQDQGMPEAFRTHLRATWDPCWPIAAGPSGGKVTTYYSNCRGGWANEDPDSGMLYGHNSSQCCTQFRITKGKAEIN